MNTAGDDIQWQRRAGDTVIWNPAALDKQPEAVIFSPDYWQARNALQGSASGRGEAYFITTADNARWVLRHYRRGGLLARVNDDAYLYTGTTRSRPFRELAILAALIRKALPVPVPVAARVVRTGLVYRADLITEEISHSTTLADQLMNNALSTDAWARLGNVIAQFHRAGLWHADLNARNVLIDASGAFHVIDLDRARFRPQASSWQQANLARFRRSLDKFSVNQPLFHFDETGWRALTDGYERALAGAGL